MGSQPQATRNRPTKPTVRSPLTDQELAEGRAYYSGAEIEAVLVTFDPRPDIDATRFAEQLEGAAWRYIEAAAIAGSGAAEPPSHTARYFRGLANRLSRLRDEFRTLGQYRRAVFNTAAPGGSLILRRNASDTYLDAEDAVAASLADAGKHDPAAWHSPNLEAAFWRAWKRTRVVHPIDADISELQRLARHAELAADLAVSKSTGQGPQTDEPLHTFVHMAVAVLEDAAATKPVAKPATDRETGERYGVVLDFLDAALRPLRFNDRRPKKNRYEELYGLLQRDRPLSRGPS